MKKDVIYIDVEDDITAIIDKVKASKAKIVALVPPKRSAVLNSAVNMKLLMKAASNQDKKAVLVTSEPTLLGLAGGVGLFVTANLHSKPYVPEAGQPDTEPEAVIDGSELDEPVSLDETDGDLAAEAGADKKTGKAFKKSKLKIPNFDTFRSKIFLIIGGILLLGGLWWWAFVIAPEATIAIKAQTTAVDVNFPFTADTNFEQDNIDEGEFIAEKAEVKRNVTESFTPTGKKNVGDKASGQMTIQNCDTSESFTIAEGTIFTSPSGLKFESLDSASVPGGTFSGGGCSDPGEATVTVRAVAPGEDHNLAEGTIYDIDGVGSLVTGYGGQMAGGTDKNVTVVAQKDVDEATEKLKNKDRSDALTELAQSFGADVVAINESYRSKLGKITSQPAIGQEATTGTVTSEVTFTLLGVSRETLTKAVENELNKAMEGGSQTIYDNGMNSLIFTLDDAKSANSMKFTLDTTGHIGPQLDTISLAQEVAGKRYSEVVSIIESKPGVVEVQVDFSPFWVFSAPSADKITIELQVNEAGA